MLATRTLLLLSLVIGLTAYVMACKPSGSGPTSETKTMSPMDETLGGNVDRLMRQLKDEDLAPWSNLGGYDPFAYCAGTSVVHAVVFNRVQFHRAPVPSLNCRGLAVDEDGVYARSAFDIISKAAVNLDFTSRQIINVYGPANFGEFAMRYVDLFRSAVRVAQFNPRIQGRDYRTYDIRTLDDLRRIVRAGNFLLIGVHVSPSDPAFDTGMTLAANSSAQVGLGAFEGSAGAQNPETFVPRGGNPKQPLNHAVLVTRVNEDNTLQVFTTWRRGLDKWYGDYSVNTPSSVVWLLHPVVIETIPWRAATDTSDDDLLHDLNQRYGYVGANSSCKPAESVTADGSQRMIRDSDPANKLDFQLEIVKNGSGKKVRVTGIRGCKLPSQSQISWTMRYTSLSETLELDHRSGSDISATSFDIDADVNRIAITGQCLGQDGVTRTALDGVTGDSTIR